MGLDCRIERTSSRSPPQPFATVMSQPARPTAAPQVAARPWLMAHFSAATKLCVHAASKLIFRSLANADILVSWIARVLASQPGSKCQIWISSRCRRSASAKTYILPERLLPHLGSEGEICFFARGAVVLDRYDPGGTVLLCLNRAETVLRNALRGRLDDDFADEFRAHWWQTWMLSDLPQGYVGQPEHTSSRYRERAPDGRTSVRDALGGEVPSRPERSAAIHRASLRRSDGQAAFVRSLWSMASEDSG